MSRTASLWIQPPQQPNESKAVGAELRLSGDARKRLVQYLGVTEARLAEGGRMELIRDWGSKLVGATVRLAGIIHCVVHVESEPWKKPISVQTLESAIAIGDYLIPHAHAVLEMMEAVEGTSGDKDARYVWRWIVENGKEQFTRRECHRARQYRFRHADDLEEPLSLLINHGYIRLSPVARVKGKGRPPSPAYDVNPEAFEYEKQNRNHQEPVTELTELHETPVEPVSVNSVTQSHQIENQNQAWL